MLIKLNAFRWNVVLLFFVLLELAGRVPRFLKTRLLSLASR